MPRATFAYNFGSAIMKPCKSRAVLTVQGFRPISYSFYSPDIDIKSHAAVTGSSDPLDSLCIRLGRRRHHARRNIEVWWCGGGSKIPLNRPFERF